MKRTYLTLLLLFTNLLISQTTIYTGDGTLTSNRTVDLGGRTLNFVPSASSPANGNLFFSTSGNIGLGKKLNL